MKRLLLFLVPLLLSNFLCYSQSKTEINKRFGAGIGYTSQNVLLMDLNYQHNRSMFRLGYGFQFNGQKGKLVSERKSNYGTTIIGSGQRYMLGILGYDYWINNQFSVGVEGALGANVYYTNYADNRFSAGGYHMNGAGPFVAGGGGKVHYRLKGKIFLGLGYNSLTGISGSVNFSL